MTTEANKTYTITLNEIQTILGCDKNLDKAEIQEKLKGLKQYPKNIYSLDDLKSIYELTDAVVKKAKQHVEVRNAQRVLQAKETRLANQAKLVKEQKKVSSKAPDDFVELGKLYAQQAKLKIEVAKLAQEQNLLDKQVAELEKKMNVR